MRMSAVQLSRSRACCTLTASGRPSCPTARCTCGVPKHAVSSAPAAPQRQPPAGPASWRACASEAEAMGASSKDANSTDGGEPRSASTVCATSAKGDTGQRDSIERRICARTPPRDTQATQPAGYAPRAQVSTTTAVPAPRMPLASGGPAQHTGSQLVRSCQQQHFCCSAQAQLSSAQAGSASPPAERCAGPA